jgi:BCCT family betaine/carnitine transporter
VALISVVRGLDGGVKRLSEINMVLAGLLLLFVHPRRTDRGDLDRILPRLYEPIKLSAPLSNPFGRDR